MGLERLINRIRINGKPDDEGLREIMLQEKERRRHLKDLMRYDKDLFYLAQDKPLEVIQEMHGSPRFWRDAEPVLAVNYDLEPELQGQLARILSRFAEAEWNSDIKYLSNWKKVFFEFYGANSTKPAEEREIFLRLLQGHDSFRNFSDKNKADEYFSQLGNDHFLPTALQLAKIPEIDLGNISPNVVRFMSDAPADEVQKLALIKAYQGTNEDVQLRVFDSDTTDEMIGYRLEMLDSPEWFQDHCLGLSNKGVKEFFIPNKHLPEAVAYALYADHVFHYSGRQIGGWNWLDSSRAMGELLSDTSIDDSSARFSIMHGAALHGKVYLNEDKFSEVTRAVDIARDVIESYLAIETKADDEKYELRNSPVIAGITRRLIEVSLSDEPDVERVLDSYRQNIGNIAEIVGNDKELDYGQIHEIVSVFPELSSGEIQAYKGAISLLERIASHEVFFSGDEGRKLLKRVPVLGEKLRDAIAVIDRYATIDTEVSQKRSGVASNPIIGAVGERLIKGLLEEKRDIEAVTAQYAENFGKIRSLVAECNNLDYHSIQNLVSMVPELLEGDISLEKLTAMYKGGYRSQCLEDLPKLRGMINSNKPTQRKLELLELYPSFKDNGFDTVEEIDFDVIELLLGAKLQPTGYLYDRLAEAEDPNANLEEWKTTLKTFSKGNFNPQNELHRSLEYTRFRKIVEHEKLRRHIKNHFTFADYQTIFDQKDDGSFDPFSDQDRFEIDCVAHEATLLKDYILAVKERADRLGRDVVVVPNLSYGYLPVSPIVDELDEAGIETIIGVKIGSTESHNNREVLNSRLFKGYRTPITNKQPVMLVVDGTYNLVTTNNRNATARYPDAHQGYLNQVIAMNDANGFTNEDYSHVGKTEEDIEKLRETPEFKRAVEVYQHVSSGRSRKAPYTFELWNTANMELAIRGEREVIATVRPYDGDIRQPTMIFCNAGVLNEQIPEEIKARFEGQHKPAYFDDSGKIIAFDFGFDNFGVRYLNRLETEVKSAYDRVQGREERTPEKVPIPAIIGYAMRNLGRTQVEERV